MINVFFIPPSQREPDYDHPDSQLPLSFGGIYFFLYPYFVELQDETGQIIDPQLDADFPKESLSIVLNKLQKARRAAEQSPIKFSVHVGKQIKPVEKDLYEEVSREQLLVVIDLLLKLFQEAAARNCRVILTEE